MDVRELLAQARDAMTVQRVFGEPVEKDGVTVIPVARVAGGAGGGNPRGDAGDREQPGRGTGAGFGLRAAPAGVYTIKGGEVSWVPAVDVNRAIIGGQLVAVVMLLTVWAIVRARARRDDD